MEEAVATKFLTVINKEFITLQDGEKHEYMIHFTHALETWFRLMKGEDKLFEAIFQRPIWSGSYYDGLKITKPEEYDVKLVMKLPIDYNQIEVTNNGVIPAFVKVKMDALADLKKHPRYIEVYKPMEGWIDEEGFLLQSKFRGWVASVVGKASATMVPSKSPNDYLYSLKESGPARTIHVYVPEQYSKPGEPRIELDFDLVPVIEFESSAHWPQPPVRENPYPGPSPPFSHMGWYIVAKPTSKVLSEQVDFYWRADYYEQESVLIFNKQNLKPALRMLKKLRDSQNLDNIKSYYIKTVFLWEIDQKPSTYWTSTCYSVMFVDMLCKLRDAFQKRRIVDYWDKRANLLTMSGMSSEEIENIAGRLDHIVREIESKRGDGYVNVFAKYLLTEAELAKYQAIIPYQPATAKFADLTLGN